MPSFSFKKETHFYWHVDTNASYFDNTNIRLNKFITNNMT